MKAFDGVQGMTPTQSAWITHPCWESWLYSAFQTSLTWWGLTSFEFPYILSWALSDWPWACIWPTIAPVNSGSARAKTYVANVHSELALLLSLPSLCCAGICLWCAFPGSHSLLPTNTDYKQRRGICLLDVRLEETFPWKDKWATEFLYHQGCFYFDRCQFTKDSPNAKIQEPSLEAYSYNTSHCMPYIMIQLLADFERAGIHPSNLQLCWFHFSVLFCFFKKLSGMVGSLGWCVLKESITPPYTNISQPWGAFLEMLSDLVIQIIGIFVGGAKVPGLRASPRSAILLSKSSR